MSRILIADDDPDIRAIVAYRLERAGHEVLEAADGDQALTLALAERPNLVVLDVMMPKRDGYTVTRELREHDETRSIPVILLTSRAQEGDVTTGFEAGATDYVRKPFSPQELRARVEAILAR